MKLVLLLLSFLAIVLPVRGDAEYVLRQGDVLSYSVIGHANFAGTTMIDTDGEASFPLIGPVEAENIGLREFKDVVRRQFTNVAYRSVDADGKERWLTISPEFVQIDIAEYRPIYVTGAVLRPGSIPFRPGMTALQGITSAGGVSAFAVRPDQVDPSEIAALRVKATVQFTRIEQSKRLLRRIEEELTALTQSFEKASDSSERDFSDWGSARDAERLVKKQALRETYEQLSNRLEVLKEQERGALESVELDSNAVERIEKLSTRGVVTEARVTEARSALLLSTSRALEIGAEVAAVEIEQTKLLLADEVNRIGEVTALLERVEELRSTLKIQNAEYQGTLRLGAIGGSGEIVNEAASYTIYRDFLDGQGHINAQLSTRLMPGDVIQVELSGPAAIAAN